MTIDADILDLYNRLQQIHVLLDDGDQRSLQGIDLSTSQYNLLLHLANKQGDKGLTITDLANLLICTRSNATRLVQRLEQQGLVQLQGDDQDRRLVRVSLSETGADILNSARKAHVASLQRRFSGLKSAHLQGLDQLTRTLVDVLETDLAALAR